MSHYSKEFVKSIIRDRANARRERDHQREINLYAQQVYVPFKEWLYYTEGIVDWRQLRKWDLRNYFCDYQLDCLRHELEWEHPQNYGLTNVLP